MYSVKIKLALFVLLTSFTSSVFAVGATVRFGATAVPSLSNTMLIVLSLLLFLVAFKIAKQKNNPTGKFFVSLLGVSAIVMGSSGGVKLVTEAQAGVPPVSVVAISSGHIQIGNGYKGVLQNETGQNLSVTITADATSRCVMTGLNGGIYSLDSSTTCGDTLSQTFGGSPTQPDLGNTVANGIIMAPNQMCYLVCGANVLPN